MREEPTCTRGRIRSIVSDCLLTMNFAAATCAVVDLLRSRKMRALRRQRALSRELAPVAALLEKRGERMDELRQKLERDVRYANITIIEGHDASQYGIGIV